MGTKLIQFRKQLSRICDNASLYPWPGIRGVSDNIRVISIVGRFLEHHRVYYFRNGEEEHIYCSSADLMERNLYNRIEVMFPILDEDCRKRIKQDIFKNYLKDNRDAWEMQHDGSYKPMRNGTYSAQEKLLEMYKVYWHCTYMIEP